MKPSAQITMWGLVLLLLGSIISAFGFATAATASRYSDDDGTVGIILGAIVVLAGAVLAMMGLYRALAKIDALPLPLDTVKNHESESSQGDTDAGDLGEPASSATPPGL